MDVVRMQRCVCSAASGFEQRLLFALLGCNFWQPTSLPPQHTTCRLMDRLLGRDRFQRLKDAYCGLCILALYFLYLMVVKGALSVFDCSKVWCWLETLHFVSSQDLHVSNLCQPQPTVCLGTDATCRMCMGCLTPE